MEQHGTGFALVNIGIYVPSNARGVKLNHVLHPPESIDYFRLAGLKRRTKPGRIRRL